MANVTNVSESPAYLNSVPPVLVMPGETVDAQISDKEVLAFSIFGVFEEAKPSKKKPDAGE